MGIEQPPIVNAYVDYDSNLVLMHREGEDRVIRKLPADFASYHRVSDVTPENRSKLERDDGLRSLRREGDWYRVEWANYMARKFALQDDGILARLKIPHYEADVHPIKRYIVDSGARIQKPRRAFFDIETDSRVSFARARAGQCRVLCWSVADEVGRVRSGCLQADSDDAERVMLIEMLRTLDDYDQIVAWNGDGFDFLVLKGDRRAQTKGRLRQLGIKVDMRRWLWLDHLALFRRMNLQVAKSGDEKQSFKLQDIAMSVLHDGKDKFDSSKTWDAWSCTDATARNNRDALVRYNAKDADLLRRIEEKTGFCALLDTIGDACGTLPDSRGMRPLNQLDPFMLRLGREKGMHFPSITRFEQEDDRKKFKGAYVQEPSIEGMLRDVHVCDFKSLYPSIIISWNMSPETKVEGSRGSEGPIPSGCSRAPRTGVMFRTDTMGFLPMAVDRMLVLRSEWKKKKASLPPGTPESADADRKSNAYKVAGNSFFGGTGNEFSRFFDVDVAESVTQAGVHLIHEVETSVLKVGWESVYQDTDGLYARGEPDRRVFSAFVSDVLNGEVIPKVLAEHGCEAKRVAISYEKQFDRIVFTGVKKRYCNPPEAPIWMADLSFKPLGEVKVGDEVVGWTDAVDSKPTSRAKRKLCRTRVVAVHRHESAIVKVTMASGRVIRCTPDHRWLHGRCSITSNSQFITPKIGRELAHVIDEPKTLSSSLSRAASWLGGLYDGEGSLAGATRANIVISQSRRANPEVCRRLESVLRRLGFSYHVHDQKNGACQVFALHSHAQERLNFIYWCRPAKAGKIEPTILRSRFARPDRIVSLEPDGFGEVIGLTTETGNYVAWGYASKNCGTYLHYEGTDPQLDSEPEIKGLEFKRGDTNKLARMLQERVIRMLLGDWSPTCSDCNQKCDHGPEDKAPKGRRTAWLWACPSCGPRGDHELRFARAIEEHEDFRVVVAKARDYVLSAKLKLPHVTVSKGIQQPIDDYIQKKKQDGTDAALPPHVQVAKLLAERGEDVSIGTKIAYVVVDGADTIKAIPASDYVGELDRYYLWEKCVWPPIERILTVALPGTPWDRMFGKVRPAKERPPKRGGAAPGQMGLFGGGVPPLDPKKFAPMTIEGTAGRPAVQTITALRGASSVPALRRSDRPFVIRLDVAQVTKATILALKEACDRSPGPRPVQLTFEGTIDCLGEASLDLMSEVRVEGTPTLIFEIERILGR